MIFNIKSTIKVILTEQLNFRL